MGLQKPSLYTTYEEIGAPPTAVMVCIRVMPDTPLRVIPQEEAEPLGYIVKWKKAGDEGLFWLISNDELVHAKSPADLAAKEIFQATGLVLDPARFELDSKWIRSSTELSNLSYWESLYFVDITESEKVGIIPNTSDGKKLLQMLPETLDTLVWSSMRGHFFRLRHSRRFAARKQAA